MERAPKQKWKMPIFNEYLKNEDSGKRRRRNVRQAGWGPEDGVRTAKGEEKFKKDRMVNIAKGCTRYIH